MKTLHINKYLHLGIVLIITFFGLCLFAAEIDEEIKRLESKLPTVHGTEKVQVLNDLSMANLGTSFENAIKHAGAALKLAQKLKDIEGEATALRYIGIGYYYKCDYDKALGHVIESLRIFEEIDNKNGISRTLNNIGLIYWRLRNHDKAIEYFTRSIKIAREIEDKKGLATYLNNIGLVYMEQEKHNKALKYYNKSLKIKEEIGYKKGISETLTNIGIANSHLGNPVMTLEYFLRALKITEEIGEKLDVATSMTNIGSVYRELKMHDKAISYLERGLKLAKEIEAKDITQEIYNNFSEIHSELGNNKKALEFYKQHSEVKDSIFTERSSKKIAEMQAKYESDKKEKEIELLKKDNIIEQSRRRMLIIFLFVTLSIVIFLFYLYRVKIGMNKKLDLLSRTDPLTKLSNRRDMLESIEQEKIRFERNKRPFVFILCDIDKFKNFNDEYGHKTGDFVLVSIAKLMLETMRKQDLVCRWGGEEFLFLLPETELDGGGILAEKMRREIADKTFHHEKLELAVNMTFGVSAYDEAIGVDECIKQADDALYEGKENGRNQVVLAKPPTHLGQ
jgi:diguanylate cyclase (GGDEF)-like protein